MKLTGENRSTRRKTCPSATLFTKNPMWTDQGSNPGLRGERPVTNRLSHGTPTAISYNVSHDYNIMLLKTNLPFRPAISK
jgi:hypothetical protein